MESTYGSIHLFLCNFLRKSDFLYSFSNKRQSDDWYVHLITVSCHLLQPDFLSEKEIQKVEYNYDGDIYVTDSNSHMASSF